MHGLIFMEIKKFADVSFGAGTYDALLKAAKLEDKIYLPVKEYPDAEAVALVVAAAEATKKSVPDVLDAFGEFIAPDLLNLYKALIDPNWKTLDLLEHTEETIHKVVRLQNPGAHPPQLKVTRTSPATAMLYYDSSRKMCWLATGIVKGLAKHYGEKLEIKDQKCMARGDDHCEIIYTTTA